MLIFSGNHFYFYPSTGFYVGVRTLLSFYFCSIFILVSFFVIRIFISHPTLNERDYFFSLFI